MSAGAIPVPWGGVAPAAGGAAASGGFAEIAAAALGRAAGVVGLIFYPSPLGDGTIIHGQERYRHNANCDTNSNHSSITNSGKAQSADQNLRTQQQ